jgi:hypothetical protein
MTDLTIMFLISLYTNPHNNGLCKLMIQNQFLVSMVVQDYLGGKTRSQIAEDRNTSTGNVSNIVEAWKKSVGIPNVDELRHFVVLVRKSGKSIRDCVQGFRIAQTMKRMGISIDGDGGGQNNYSDFCSFVEELYLACKNLDISPAVVPMWINDLRICYAFDRDNQLHPPKGIAEYGQDGYDGKGDCEGITPFAQEQKNSTADKNHGSNHLVPGYAQSPGKGDSDNNLKGNQPLSGNDAEIPFMSRISSYIEKGKKSTLDWPSKNCH